MLDPFKITADMVSVPMRRQDVAQLRVVTLLEHLDNALRRLEVADVDGYQVARLRLHQHITNVVLKERIKVEVRDQRVIVTSVRVELVAVIVVERVRRQAFA